MIIRIAGLAVGLVLVSSELVAVEKVRIFVTDSQSWETGGAVVAPGPGGGGAYGGGARPQNAEIAKTIRERCPELTVTINRERADYILTLDHEGGKGIFRKDNKWVLYGKGGDMIDSGSTRSLGNSVKNACSAVANDQRGKPYSTAENP